MHTHKFSGVHTFDARRRVVLGGLAAGGVLAACGSLPTAGAPTRTRFAYVGCRTTKERNARGEGISVYRVDQASQQWSLVQLHKGLVNPSFLAFDRTERFLYAVHGDLSEISAFSIDPDGGTLQLLNQQSTEGKNPVHLVADQSNRYIIVTNYATGSLVVLPRNADGTLGQVKQLEKLPGEIGPHRVDQGFSHPHQVIYDRTGQTLLVPDKGLDRVFSFRFDSGAGRLVPGPVASVRTRPGAGPRHAVFHPTAPFVYLAHELDSSVGAYRYDAEQGALTPIQVIPSTSDTFTGANTAAEIDIAPSGRFVYVSNRGNDTVGVFRTDAATGRLTPVGWTGSEGKGPRFITLDPSGSSLYAANENSDTIVAFRVDPDAGELRPTGQMIPTGSPVCIVFSTK